MTFAAFRLIYKLMHLTRYSSINLFRAFGFALLLAFSGFTSSVWAAPDARQSTDSKKDFAEEKNELELSRYPTIHEVALQVSHSRLFRTGNKIIQVFTTEPGVAEPVVVAENQFVLLGKTRGTTNLVVWDDAGHVSNIKLQVERRIHGARDQDLADLSADRNCLKNMCDTSEAGQIALGEVCNLISREKKRAAHRQKNATPPDTKPTPDPYYAQFLKRCADLRSKISYDPAVSQKVPSGSIELAVSHATIITSPRPLSCATSDHKHVEYVPLSEQELALIGRLPGTSKVEVTDGHGKSQTIETKVARANSNLLERIINRLHDFFSNRSNNSDLAMLPVSSKSPIAITEFRVAKRLNVPTSHPKQIKLQNRVVRTSIADPGIAEPFVISESQIVIVGKQPGSTTFFLWDDAGNCAGIELTVAGTKNGLQEMIHKKIATDTGASENEKLTGEELIAPRTETENEDIAQAEQPPSLNHNKLHDIIIWSGKRMDILSVPKS